MKVVLDTNVFVSGVFFGGPPHKILEAWRDGKVQERVGVGSSTKRTVNEESFSCLRTAILNLKMSPYGAGVDKGLTALSSCICLAHLPSVIVG